MLMLLTPLPLLLLFTRGWENSFFGFAFYVNQPVSDLSDEKLPFPLLECGVFAEQVNNFKGCCIPHISTTFFDNYH